ncbi:SGNH hydrolase-type esterase domain-containing protein [Nemania serpens]|nr:SGNH hydrolase-type esterase domain-containing protein [Nemania serpens]
MTVIPIAQGAPLRILSLGDSITLGYNDPTGNSYRRELQRLLWTSGNPVAMVGSVRSGDWDDNAVDAWIYHTIDDILEKSKPELTRSVKEGRPNVITLHAGTVNFVLGKNVTTAPERLGHLIDVITAHNPLALLVVSQLLPYFHNETVDNLVKQYNRLIPSVIATRARAGRRVVLTSMDGFMADMLPDGVHPSGIGSLLMAQHFYEAIREADKHGLLVPADEEFEDRGESSVFLPGEGC